MVEKRLELTNMWGPAGWKWIVAILALLEAGWMTFDGLRAHLTGSYTTGSGEYAGQLGPWASIVSAVGINPLSVGMRWLFFIYGASWIVVTICFLLNLRWTKWAMIIAAIGSLWFLPFGTLLSVVQIVVLVYKVNK
jgi:hypothetical protein